MKKAFRVHGGTIGADRGRSAPTEEDMFNTPLALFHDRADADVSLGELRDAYSDYLRGREKPASANAMVSQALSHALAIDAARARTPSIGSR